MRRGTVWLGMACASLLFVAGTALASLLPATTMTGLISTSTETVPANPPAAPTLAPLTADTSGVTLSWTATSSSDGTPAAFYTVYRGDASGEETWLGTVNTVTTYKDTTTVKGNAYTYQVTASNNGGESARSNERAIVAAGPRARELLEVTQVYPVGSWSEAVAIGDVTGDGLNDAVMTTSYYSDPGNDFHLFVFVGNAEGTLGAPFSYPTAGQYSSRPESVAIGDITGDGRKDVVVALDGVGVQVFPQTATGSLGSPTLTATTDSYKIRLGRLNGDNRIDVAGIGWGNRTATPSVSVLLNNGNGGLQSPVPYPVQHGGYDDLEVGDVSGDGRDDLVVMSGQSNIPNFGVLTQQASGGFAAPAYYKVSQGTTILTQGIGLGDVTGDGRNDVVATYGGNAGKIAAFAQTSVGTLAAPVEYSSYDIPSPVDVADLDLDGRSDVVTLHDSWNAVGVYRQKADHTLAAQEIFSNSPYTATFNPHELAVGDVSADGVPDVVYASYRRGLVVMRNTTPPAGATVPAAPTLDSATPAGQAEVELSWTPASNGGSQITAYRIYRGTASGTETFLRTVSSVTAFIDTNLAGGSTYFYRVSAVNSVGESVQSNELSTMPSPATPPDAPTIAAAGGYNKVFLEWGYSAPNGAPISGYNVYRGTASGEETFLAHTGTLTSYTDTTAVGGTTYYYEITAINSAGEGARSNEVTATALTPARPDAPVLGEPSAGVGRVTLSWNVPASNDGNGISKYTVYRGTAAGAETFLADTTFTTYFDSSGVPGVTYYYEVAASNSVGESIRSNEVHAASIKAVFQPYQALSVGSSPKAVAIGDVTGDGRNDVVMSTWYANDPARDFRLYVFAQKADGTLAPPVSYATAAGYTNSADSVAIGDITGDGKADVVVAVRGVGMQVFPQTALGTLGAPTLTSATAVGIIRLGQLDGDGRLDVASTGTSTQVFYNDGHGGLRTPVAPNVPGASDLDIADLTGDGRDDIVLLLGNNVGIVPQLDNGIGPIAAQYPTGTNSWGTRGIGVGDVTGDGHNDVVVTYGGNKPTSFVALLAYDAVTHELSPPSAYTSYDLPSPVDAADLDLDGIADIVTLHDGWLNAGVYRGSATGALPAEELYSLPYGDGYQRHGLAIGDVNGDGSPDVAVADHNNGLVLLRNKTAPTGVPRAPVLTTAIAGVGSVALTWAPPGSQGASPSGYRVYRGTASGAETLLATLGSTTSYVDSTAGAGTYYYRVSAVNVLGEGPFSNERSATPSSPSTAPGAPVLTSAAPAAGGIAIAWSPPASDGGSPVTAYTVYRGTTSGSETQLATLGNVTSYTDPAVTNGTTYFYVVTARNTVGEGPRSNERSARADTAAPSTPAAPKLVIAGNAQLALDWAPSTDNTAVTAYRVYRNGTLIATVAETAYLDSGLAAATTYAYSVRAVDAAGNVSSASSSLSAKTASNTNASTGTLGGAVYDRTGKPLANAVVSIKVGNSVKTAKTNASGAWKLTNVPPATYSSTIALSGYTSQTISITAAAGKTVLAATLLAPS